MSYDLMVFDPTVPPRDREGFMSWYREQTEWSETHDYNDPTVCAPALKAWFMEMIEQYPAMNGPYASDNYDDPKVSDYCIGRSVIYVTFVWSQGDGAYHATRQLAEKHGVGFFDVSADDGEVWQPRVEGGYVCVHGRGCSVVQLGTPRSGD